MENSQITFENSGKPIRFADSLEADADMSWLSASGTLSKSVITAEQGLKNLRKNYKTLLSNYPTLRIKLTKKDDAPFWFYATDEEIQFNNLVQLVDAPFIDEVPNADNIYGKPLWKIHLSQHDNKTKIRIIICHGITAGRPIFELLDIITSYVLDQELSDYSKSFGHPPVLYEYGKKDWYTKEITENFDEDPYSNDQLNGVKVNPSVQTPIHIINPQWDVEYPPISKFCRKHGFTPQSVLMAIQNEAIRKYNHGKVDDALITIYIPTDCRKSKYATELFKKCLFFTSVGTIMPSVKNQHDILENIKHCTQALKESLEHSNAAAVSYNSANMRNFETHELKFPDHYPDPLTIVFASHIGLVGVGLDDIQFRNNSIMEDGTYWPCFYGFHNKNVFSFMFSIPHNCPPDFLESVKDTSLKYYDFILKDVNEK